MTVVVLAAGQTLSRALADSFADAVVIDGHDAVDDTIWRTLAALQTAHASMARGGRIVLILPTIGMTGAAGLVDYTTAIEGIRALAKSAARQWTSDGTRVNMIAAPLALFATDGDTSHLTAAAVQHDETLIHSIVETAKFLLRHDVDHLTGDTIVVDGGSVMLP
jgi:3-oxoacyl-[acyl-carrier protein] reductase